VLLGHEGEDRIRKNLKRGKKENGF
jgi:hypothetical protein